MLFHSFLQPKSYQYNSTTPVMILSSEARLIKGKYVKFQNESISTTCPHKTKVHIITLKTLGQSWKWSNSSLHTWLRVYDLS